MNQYIKNILEKCNEAYSKGEFYVLEPEDTMVIEQALDLVAPLDEVTDQIYDAIYYTAKDLWPDDPFFNKLTSENTGFGQDIVHEIPMGSMEELKENDFDKWSKGHEQFMISDKLDGCSIILTYIDGRLKIAATRGHGTKGKDIMRHVKYIPNIPEKIDALGKLIVRGELLFKRDKIDEILAKIEETTGKKQKNGRNSISGALNAKETNIYIFENTNFVAYWTSDLKGLAFEQLKSLGFETPVYEKVYTKNLNDDILTNLVKTRRESSEYELDGIILTQIDNVEDGFVGGTINPKCSRKFKLGIYDNYAESTVIDIYWQISRWGVFTPVLKIEPVEVAGALISSITAHNYENVIKSKCGIGAKIKFKRAGLVIPKLEEVIIPSENYNLPQCKLCKIGVDLVCDENDEAWSNDPDLGEFIWEKDLRALEYFAEKLEIDQFKSGNCTKLYSEYSMEYDARLLPIYVFSLKDEFIISVLGKNGEKMVASLKAKKQALTEIKLAAATGAFGPDIGERVLQLVWDTYGTLENLTRDKLEKIEGFGEARIEQYINWQDNWSEMKEVCKKFGVNFINEEKLSSDKLKDYVICFTGVRDKNFANYVNKNGGIATDTWKKDVTHLVVKDKNSISSKTKKAQEAGIPIMTLEEIYKETCYDNNLC